MLNYRLRDIVNYVLGIIILTIVSMWFTPEDFMWIWGLGAISLIALNYVFTNYELKLLLEKTFNKELLVLMLGITIINLVIESELTPYLVFINWLIVITLIALLIIDLKNGEIDDGNHLAIIHYANDVKYGLNNGYYKMNGILVHINNDSIYLIVRSEDCYELLRGDADIITILSLYDLDIVEVPSDEELDIINSSIAIYNK